MAQIIMCDNCGAVTNNPGARVHVNVNPRLLDAVVTVVGPNYSQPREVHADAVLDWCVDCTKKNMTPRTVKVLSPGVDDI